MYASCSPSTGENGSDDHRSRASPAVARPGIAGAAARAPARRRRVRVLPRRRHRPRRAPRSHSTPTTTSTSPRTPGPKWSRRSCAAGPTTCGSRASASAPSAASATASRWRSPRSAPRSTAPRAASPRSPTPTTSRPTSRAATSPSTRWRSGCPNPSCRSVRRRRRSRGAAAPHAARARGLVPRRPAADAARGAVHRRLRARARARAGARGRRAPRRGSRSSSAERIRDELSKLLRGRRPERRACGSSSRPGSPTSSCPSSARCGSSRIRCTRTRTCSRTRSRSCATRGPSCACASPRCSTTSGKPKTRSFATGAVSFHHHEVVGARMTEERLRALKYPNDIIDDVTKLVYLHLRIHTYAMGWTDKAVRRYVRDAGPVARRAQPPPAVRLHHPQPEPGARARAADGRARGAHRRAARAGGARLDPPAARRPAGHGVPRRRAGPGRGGGARLPARGPSRRGPDGREPRPTAGSPSGRARGITPAAGPG